MLHCIMKTLYHNYLFVNQKIKVTTVNTHADTKSIPKECGLDKRVQGRRNDSWYWRNIGLLCLYYLGNQNV